MQGELVFDARPYVCHDAVTGKRIAISLYDSEAADGKIRYGYTETRARYNAEAFLEGFSGYLMTDGYQGYNHLPGITRPCCWAHVRRYFHDAVPQGKKLDYAHPAVQGVVYCDKLFAIERYCKEHGFTAEQRHDYHLKKASPILAAFWSWLDKLKDCDKGSRLGKAIQYALNRKPYLETHLEDGRCSLSNNDSENSIRPFCVGRRNWLFSAPLLVLTPVPEFTPWWRWRKRTT